MPERIQLSRRKGWRKPGGVIVVARPSKWGNPFRVMPYGGGWQVADPAPTYFWFNYKADAAQYTCDLYLELHLGAAIGFGVVRAELVGRDLACWCPLKDAEGNRFPCHADVLLEIANPGLVIS